MSDDVLGPLLGLFAIVTLFIALPWLILHYVTKWKQAPKITVEDEQLLDDMFNLARRLEERLQTVERIAAADHPDWRPGMPALGGDGRPGLNAPAPDWQPGMTGAHPSYTADRRN